MMETFTKYLVNRFTIYALMPIAFAMIAIFLGCEAENPICTPNFCAVGEIFPRSELEPNQEFAEAPIDDAQLVTLIGRTPETPTTPTPETPDTSQFDDVQMPALVRNVINGGQRYNQQIIGITAEISHFHVNQTYLKTNASVEFVIEFSSSMDPMLKSYKSAEKADPGKQHTFTLFIRGISPPDTGTDHYIVWARPI